MARARACTLVLLVAATAGLLSPIRAAAATWKVPRAPLAGGPSLALAGDRVAWLAAGDGGGADLYLARPDHPPERVQRFAGRGVYALAASPSRIALLRRDGGRLDVFAGPLGATLRRIEHCAASLRDPGIDVSDALVAFPACDGRLVVRDTGGARPDVVLGTAAHEAQLAGRRAAWVETGVWDRPRLVVYDLARREVSYSVGGVGVLPLTVQANGKVTFAIGSDEREAAGLEELGWATPRKPVVNRFNVAARFAYFPRLVDGRVVFGRSAVKASDADHRELGVTDLWSGQVRILSESLTGTNTVDFDGTRVAYAERRANGVLIRTRAQPSTSLKGDSPR
jgi:hypothetical protein